MNIVVIAARFGRIPEIRLAASLVFAMLVGSCSSEQWLSTLNALTPDSHYHKIEDLRYGKDVRHTMDWYRPDPQRIESNPSDLLVIFIHGGAWREGDKKDYEFVAASLTNEGHQVLIPNYRLYPGVTFPAFVEDVAAAISTFEAFSAKNDNAPVTDGAPAKGGTKLVLMGHSSGAHQAALLATDPSYLQQHGVQNEVVALVALSGPYDLPLDNPEVSVVFPALTSSIEANPVQQVAIASQKVVLPKILLLHGEEDERVSKRHTERFAAALQEAQASVVVRYVDRGHASAVVSLSQYLQHLNDALQHVINFLANLS